ncbi:hypothetical protein ACQP00_31235 [Dactylosporangium sp. CS-047395]|uniref:hypothetical protein n=1 Tax=Dactylosporangium sp. CS-047395 TaxID=3239936 RepID=UPI003D8A6124
MPTRVAHPDESLERRDLELGRTLRAWADAHADSLDLELHGPLDSPGMDPTWVLRLAGSAIEAEVHLFYGPRVDIAMFLTRRPEDGMFVGGEHGITGERLVELLDGLDQLNRGATVPAWLRRA